MLLKLSTGLKFRGFQSWNFVEVKFAVGKKSWYSQKLNFATWQKNCETAKFSSRENFRQSKRYLMKKSSLALVNLLI